MFSHVWAQCVSKRGGSLWPPFFSRLNTEKMEHPSEPSVFCLCRLQGTQRLTDKQFRFSGEDSGGGQGVCQSSGMSGLETWARAVREGERNIFFARTKP